VPRYSSPTFARTSSTPTQTRPGWAAAVAGICRAPRRQQDGGQRRPGRQSKPFHVRSPCRNHPRTGAKDGCCANRREVAPPHGARSEDRAAAPVCPRTNHAPGRARGQINKGDEKRPMRQSSWAW
jgi:hypothetical protein